MVGENIWPWRKLEGVQQLSLPAAISPSRCEVRTSSRDALSGVAGLSTWLPPLGLPRVCHSTACQGACRRLLSFLSANLTSRKLQLGEERRLIQKVIYLNVWGFFLLVLLPSLRQGICEKEGKQWDY